MSEGQRSNGSPLRTRPAPHGRARLNAEVVPGGPADTRRFQVREIELWKRIGQKAKVEQQ